MSDDQRITVERVIDAPAERIFDVLADASLHPVIDGSGTVESARGDRPDRLHEGARFGMNMKMGVPYTIKNVVLEFEEGRLITWRHWGRHRWRWELEPRDDGATDVRHSFIWSTAPLPVRLYIETMGIPDKNRRGMERTVRNLEQHVTGSDAADAGRPPA